MNELRNPRNNNNNKDQEKKKKKKNWHWTSGIRKNLVPSLVSVVDIFISQHAEWWDAQIKIKQKVQANTQTREIKLPRVWNNRIFIAARGCEAFRPRFSLLLFSKCFHFWFIIICICRRVGVLLIYHHHYIQKRNPKALIYSFSQGGWYAGARGIS